MLLADGWILFLSAEPAYLVVLCEEELVVIDLVTKEAGYVRHLRHVSKI